MAEVFPRRNLPGPADYWGRVIEDRVTAAGRAWDITDSSLAGLDRAGEAQRGELSRQIEDLEDAFKRLSTAGTNASSATGFALSTGWNTVLTADIEVPEGKTRLNALAIGRVTVRDDGPTPGDYGTFQWVFDPGLVSSEYGWRDTGFHSGIDFAGGAASSGSPIYAPADGTVAGKGTDGSRGNYLNLSHPGGLTTRYFHLISSSPLSPGDSVTRGVTILGYVGNTGASFGAHLHWETYIEGSGLNEEGYPAMNPREFMAIFGGSGTPPVGEYSDLRAQIVIAGNPSLQFEAYKKSYNDPARIHHFLYPQHGLTYTGSTAQVQLDIYSSADIPADSFNTATLAAYGVFS